MTYLLDANVFIQAKNLQYGFDFCPAFWDWLDEQSEAGHVGSIEKVLDELKAGGDDLSTWAIARPGLFRAARHACCGEPSGGQPVGGIRPLRPRRCQQHLPPGRRLLPRRPRPRT